MPKFAANLSFVFTEVPFPERFGRTAAAGLIERRILFPYDQPASDIADWLDNDLEQVLFNLPAGDWAAGERGLACLPQRQGEFAADRFATIGATWPRVFACWKRLTAAMPNCSTTSTTRRSSPVICAHAGHRVNADQCQRFPGADDRPG